MVLVLVVFGFGEGGERNVVDGHRAGGKCWGIIMVGSGVVGEVVDV